MKQQLNLQGTIPWGYRFGLQTKITMLLIFTLCFSFQAKASYAQKTKITINFENTTIGAAIGQIESATEFKFIFNTDDVDLNRKLSLSFKNATIKTVLDEMFKAEPINYEVVDKKILLKRVIKTSSNENLPQDFEVSGLVLDELGTPLPGASILEKGTTNGTQSDFDGNFNL